MLFSKIFKTIKADAILIVGLAIVIFSLGGLAYVYGKHAVLKSQHEQLTEINNQNLQIIADLQSEKSRLIDTNHTNTATIEQLTADLGKAQILINENAQRALQLQSRITRLQIESAKGTDQDGVISPIMVQTLQSIPGATK